MKCLLMDKGVTIKISWEFREGFVRFTVRIESIRATTRMCLPEICFTKDFRLLERPPHRLIKIDLFSSNFHNLTCVISNWGTWGEK